MNDVSSSNLQALILLACFSSVTLIAEEAEDMWHAYNLIQINDTIKSTTIRLDDVYLLQFTVRPLSLFSVE